MAEKKNTLPEELAGNPNTPPETLRELVQNENIDIRMTVAANPSIPLDLAESLMQEDDQWLRMNVARYSPHLEILKKLAEDEVAWVREAVAKNPNTPTDLLEMLYVPIGFGRYKLNGKEDDKDADVYIKSDAGKYVKASDDA